MLNQDVATLVSYAISLSLKLKRGSTEVGQCISQYRGESNCSVSICEADKERRSTVEKYDIESSFQGGFIAHVRESP
jgi:hypothetical protein